MKELSEERVQKLYTENVGFEPGPLTTKAVQEAYRLGQQEAVYEKERIEAAVKILAGMYAGGANVYDLGITRQALLAADALIAELNRTAEKGGEG